MWRRKGDWGKGGVGRKASQLAVLWMQGVDKQSDSDRLCLHSLFSNRPTHSHQRGAHMCTLTNTHYRVERSRTHRCCQSSSTLCVTVLSAHIVTFIVQIHTDKTWRKASRVERLVLNVLLPMFQIWGNGAIMTGDETATMISSLSIMFHCAMKKKLPAVSSTL